MRWAWALLLVMLALPSLAQERSAMARVDLAGSSLTAEGRDKGKPRPLELRLGLSGPVPYRVYFLDGPPRLVIDFREVDFSAADADALAGRSLVPALRWGRFRPGWSRLVMELPGPYALRLAVQNGLQGGAAGAQVMLRLEPVPQAEFRSRGNALSALWDLPEPSLPAMSATPRQNQVLRVALDPGHGGHDPGAEVGAIRESAVLLSFARELSEVLTRAGYDVVQTRNDDSFVGLEQRMTIARAAQADLFISLHADALPEGQAAGLSIHVWNPDSDDRAARQLAARHDRSDLVTGLDLQGTDDQVAAVLMDLARQQTQPRSEAFAKFLLAELTRAKVPMHARPVQGAAFSVLKSPDIPSVLIELGFLTDPRDRANLFNPEWRQSTSNAIAAAIAAWSQDDAVRAGLSRR
ncbi:N-acetylmuramoyl-L-alanine amidase [Paracoccus sp. MBLB3053]|uniref:N-acetylmuramoyl-L-alanine amidase n=1 Tax=Paracoccus aurantius TaxID=3073814 RepID=A0ABU2HSS5_9RHOB|nr:N-acetylmuramoyl-L-alanine amidase [Paracoccus sp. MBLB3053]MDS9468097.1 N-acetylmuramoyl-L-alanine amidase [Paracoccus sp. MBLB3053]